MDPLQIFWRPPITEKDLYVVNIPEKFIDLFNVLTYVFS